MANRNIQMKKRNGDTWDNLYPITLDTNVFNENGISVSERLAQTEHKINRVKFSELQEPIFIAHRGGSNIFPENTLEAYEGCLSMGVNVIEQDVQQLADGALAVIHSQTMHGTTNRSGYVRDYSTMGFKRAKVTTLPGWDDVRPPLFEEVLSRFGNNAIYIIESKDRRSAKKIADTLKRYRLEEYACIQSFELADLQEVTNEGIPLMYLQNDNAPLADPQEIKSNNIDYIGVSTNASESFIQSCISAGLKVVVWGVNRRYERDYYLNLGVSGFFSDDPLYVQGKSPVLSKDPFGEQVFTHGMIPSYTTDRGVFLEGNRWGFDRLNDSDDGRDFVLQGWAGELPQTFELNFDIKLHGGPRWCSTAICTPIDYFDDNKTNLSNGYHILFLVDGRIGIYKIKNGEAIKLGESSERKQIEEGQTVPIRVSVTSTSITAERTDLGYSVSINDTEFRGGYLHFGRRESKWSFGNVSIT